MAKTRLGGGEIDSTPEREELQSHIAEVGTGKGGMSHLPHWPSSAVPAVLLALPEPLCFFPEKLACKDYISWGCLTSGWAPGERLIGD